MTFLMYCSDHAEKDSLFNKDKPYDLAIVGNPIDDRGKDANQSISNFSNQLLILEYIPDEMVFKIGEEKEERSLEDFQDWLSNKINGFKNGVIIEATTLGFAEIFLSVSALLNANYKKIDFLYIEPEGYKGNLDRTQEYRKRFDLSEECGEFIGIPNAAININANDVKKGIFFLGYEDNRFDRMFQELDGERPAQKCPVVFGVPPFQASWELNSFRANIKVLSGHSLRDGVYFCPANNPLAVYEFLDEQHKTLSAEEKMFIAPLGTKPESIGIATFVAEKNLEISDKIIGLLYDHPKRKVGRSERVYKWHIYKLI